MGRHHIYEKQGGPKSLELKEIGPRFELRLYQVTSCHLNDVWFLKSVGKCIAQYFVFLIFVLIALCCR